MKPTKWKLDHQLICPQCRHYNALVFKTRDQYMCRDCGYLYDVKASLCEGCKNPITKKCGMDCYADVH